MKVNTVLLVKKLLQIGKQTIKLDLSLETETGSINKNGDFTIKMDVEIEKRFIDYIVKHNFPLNIYSEEKGFFKFHKDPQFTIVFDPLDGTTNYKINRKVLPFGTLITIYRGLTPCLEDVVAAGAVEYTSNLIWIYDGQKTFDLKGNQIKIKHAWRLDLATPFCLDLYYKNDIQKYLLLMNKLFVRNTGSNAGNLALVLQNAASGLGGSCVKPEEVGAIYGLVKGAGGIIKNFVGEEVDQLQFVFDKTYAILAGSKGVIDSINLN